MLSYKERIRKKAKKNGEMVSLPLVLFSEFNAAISAPFLRRSSVPNNGNSAFTA
jgi:hypothetical protein